MGSMIAGIGILGIITYAILLLIGSLIGALALYLIYMISKTPSEQPGFGASYKVALLSAFLNTVISMVMGAIFSAFSAASVASNPMFFVQHLGGAAIGMTLVIGVLFAGTLFLSTFLAHKIVMSGIGNGDNSKVSGIYTGVFFTLFYILPLALFWSTLGAISQMPDTDYGNTMDATTSTDMGVGDAPAADATGSPENEQALESLEQFVGAYEELAANNPICLSDLMKFNTETLPKMNEMSNNMQSGSAMSPEQMSRMSELMTRMQAAAMKLSEAPTNSDC
ncbi:MAG: hypothetical protein ACKOXK_06510 [Chakrabartia sp.]